MLVPWTLLSKICRQAIKGWDQNNQRTVKLGNWSFPEFHVFCLSGCWVQSQRLGAVRFIECLLLKRCWNERHWGVAAFVFAGLETEGSADKGMYSPLQEHLSLSPGIHIWWFTTISNSNFRGYQWCWPLQAHAFKSKHKHRETQKHFIIIKIK